jgi:hypothetical protein
LLEVFETMRVTAVTTATPNPRKPRLLGFVRALREAGHEVCVVATADLSSGAAPGAEEQGRAQLQRLGASVTHVPFRPGPVHLARSALSVALRRYCSETALYDSRSLSAEIARAVEATRPDVVHVDRARAVPLVRSVSVPLVVDLTDPRLAAYRLYRAAGLQNPVAVALAEMLRSLLDRRPAAREETSALAGIPVLVASKIGRRSLLDAGAEPGLLWDVPNAVFADERAEPLESHSRPPVIGMSGNLSYPPNVLGFGRFASTVLSRLRQETSARIVLIGSAPHGGLLRRARRAGVEIHSDVESVPATIRALGVSLMLSPQTVSAGFPNRVVDAVYRSGVPIVASAETVAGMADELASMTPLARLPEEWLARTCELLAVDTRELVLEMQRQIEAGSSPGAVSGALTAAYDRALRAAQPAPGRAVSMRI